MRLNVKCIVLSCSVVAFSTIASDSIIKYVVTTTVTGETCMFNLNDFGGVYVGDITYQEAMMGEKVITKDIELDIMNCPGYTGFEVPVLVSYNQSPLSDTTGKYFMINSGNGSGYGFLLEDEKGGGIQNNQVLHPLLGAHHDTSIHPKIRFKKMPKTPVLAGEIQSETTFTITNN